MSVNPSHAPLFEGQVGVGGLGADLGLGAPCHGRAFSSVPVDAHGPRYGMGRDWRADGGNPVVSPLEVGRSLQSLPQGGDAEVRPGRVDEVVGLRHRVRDPCDDEA